MIDGRGAQSPAAADRSRVYVSHNALLASIR